MQEMRLSDWLGYYLRRLDESLRNRESQSVVAMWAAKVKLVRELQAEKEPSS